MPLILIPLGIYVKNGTVDLNRAKARVVMAKCGGLSIIAKVLSRALNDLKYCPRRTVPKDNIAMRYS